MRRRTFAIIAVAVLLVLPAWASQDGDVHLHLPRAVRVSSQTLRLGEVAVIRCEDEAIAEAASAIEMGRAPWSGEAIEIDRATILSRLASIGVDRSRVQLTGSESVHVQRDETILAPERLTEAARSVIKAECPAEEGCRWVLARAPGPVIVPAGIATDLQAERIDEDVDGVVAVRVEAIQRERVVGRVVLRFHLAYPTRHAVAKQDIPAGELITPENAAVEVTYVPRKMAAWTSPMGMLAARPIREGAIIRANMVRTKHAPISIRRAQQVTMRIEGEGFVIAALGEALDAGREGDLIRVKNVDTEQVVRAQVMADGAVRPLLSTDPDIAAAP